MSLWALKPSECKTVTKASSPLANPPPGQIPSLLGRLLPLALPGPGQWQRYLRPRHQGHSRGIHSFPVLHEKKDGWMVSWTDDGLTDGWTDRKMDEEIYGRVGILSLDSYPACKLRQKKFLAQDVFGVCSFCPCHWSWLCGCGLGALAFRRSCLGWPRPNWVNICPGRGMRDWRCLREDWPWDWRPWLKVSFKTLFQVLDCHGQGHIFLKILKKYRGIKKIGN